MESLHVLMATSLALFLSPHFPSLFVSSHLATVAPRSFLARTRIFEVSGSSTRPQPPSSSNARMLRCYYLVTQVSSTRLFSFAPIHTRLSLSSRPAGALVRNLLRTRGCVVVATYFFTRTHNKVNISAFHFHIHLQTHRRFNRGAESLAPGLTKLALSAFGRRNPGS
jgi:hypothetical protein